MGFWGFGVLGFWGFGAVLFFQSDEVGLEEIVLPPEMLDILEVALELL